MATPRLSQAPAVQDATSTKSHTRQRPNPNVDESLTKVSGPVAQQGQTVRKPGKKAVISTGGKQYLVSEGDELEVELLEPSPKASFGALLVIDGEKVSVGTPYVTGAKVDADVTDQMVKAKKVVAIRYKAKKRVHKVRGHRQKHTLIKITKITP